MIKAKFISLGFVVLMFFCLLTGCSSIKYNAVMYSASEDLILSSFLEDNKVKGAYYKNPDFNENIDDSNDEYYYDETSPVYRTFIVNSQDTYNEIFADKTLTVDFDKEILYLHIFADTYPSRNYVIDNILIEEEQINIYYKLDKNNKNDATAPYQRCLVVVMKKTDTSTVEFIKQK